MTLGAEQVLASEIHYFTSDWWNFHIENLSKLLFCPILLHFKKYFFLIYKNMIILGKNLIVLISEFFLLAKPSFWTCCHSVTGVTFFGLLLKNI